MPELRPKTAIIAVLSALVATGTPGRAEEGGPAPSAASMTAANLADFFSQVGDQIYENCIYELSDEQIEVQRALIDAYIKQGASSILARQLAVRQIQPPPLSDKCQKLRASQQVPSAGWSTKIAVPKKPPPVPVVAKEAPPTKDIPSAPVTGPAMRLADMKVLPQWDCAPGVDFVTIRHKGFERKLTGGEICNPFEDVVRHVPETSKPFKLGYTIRTGRLFVISDDPQVDGRTIAWAISGREACRNNPDPECFAARAVGPLPPGEYAFSSDKKARVSWGPTSKRMVAGVYMTRLWNTERFTPAQTAAIKARGNIAIHVRLKGEMSEACLGLGTNGWDYISSLIKSGRATGLNVHIDEPHPQLAEKAPIHTASSFSLSALFR